MNKIPKLLIVTPLFPFPSETGGSQVLFQIIDYLKTFYQITIACHFVKDEGLSIANTKWKDVKVLILNSSTEVKKKEKTKSSIGSRVLVKIYKTLNNKGFIPPTHYLYPRLPEMPDFFYVGLEQHLKSERYDIIQCEFIPSLHVINFLSHFSINVFIHHELDFVCGQRLVKRLNLFLTLLLLPQQRIKKNQELKYLSKYDAIIVFSEIDKQKLEAELTSKKIYVSPFPTKLDRYNKINQNFEFQQRLIFLGSSVHYPNEHGLKWFIDKVWIKLLSLVPELHLDIIGYWDEALIKKYNSIDRICFRGYVENLETLLEGSIMIVPIHIGSGIRTKVLEAFAARVPVISTSVGVEGILVEHGTHCLIANTPNEFKKQIFNLVNNQYLQNKLINVSEEFLQDYYNPNKLLEKRLEILKTLTNQSAVD